MKFLEIKDDVAIYELDDLDLDSCQMFNMNTSDYIKGHKSYKKGYKIGIKKQSWQEQEANAIDERIAKLEADYYNQHPNEVPDTSWEDGSDIYKLMNLTKEDLEGVK